MTAGSFSGSPKTASVTFTTAFANTNYAITFSGVDNRNITYQSKTASGFTINLNANQVPTGEVSWIAIQVGEN